MKTTVIILLDPRRPKNDDSYPISLRIIHKRMPIYINTGFSVIKEHWDEKLLQITKECKKYARLVLTNNTIRQKLIDASEIIEDLNKTGEIEKLTPTELKTKILNKSVRTTFREFNNKIIAELKLAKKLGNASCYEQAQAFLDRHANEKELYFDDINYKLLKQVEAKHLSNDNSLNSLSFYLRTIRATYNRAIKEGVAKRDTYPFSQYSIKETKTVKRAIHKTDIEKIRDLVLEEGTHTWHARNYFMFSFYNIGMNFADIANLKINNIKDDRMEYVRAKTGKTYSVKLTNPSKDILAFYIKDQEEDGFVFPIIKRESLEDKMKDRSNERKLFNKYLGKIAKLAEIKANLTSYGPVIHGLLLPKT